MEIGIDCLICGAMCYTKDEDMVLCEGCRRDYIFDEKTEKYIKKVGPIKEVSTVDNINNPSHYTSHPSGIQPIEITKYHDFCTGNVIKYAMRAGLKGNKLEDLKKMACYAQWAVELEKSKEKGI